MSPSRPRRSLRLVLSAVLAALVAACATPPPLPPGADNPGLAEHGLKSANPLDIAVLPIENQTGLTGLPLESMRRHFQAGLVARHYSPLALDYVDGRAIEAGYQPGASDENAVLKVTITGWDDHNWKTHARLVIDADVWLLDAAQAAAGQTTGSAPAQALWGGHVSRTMEMGRAREIVAGEPPLVERTVSEFVEQVLASLPARRPDLASAR